MIGARDDQLVASIRICVCRVHYCLEQGVLSFSPCEHISQERGSPRGRRHRNTALPTTGGGRRPGLGVVAAELGKGSEGVVVGGWKADR